MEAALHKWMLPGVAEEPLALFRLLEHHGELAGRMRVLGAGLLAHGVLPAVDRELVIARVCARCDCRYEWGVHIAAFASRVGLTAAQIAATVDDDAEVWSERQRALIDAVDELHDTARIGDPTWRALTAWCSTTEVVELLVLCGWYRTIAYVANGTALDDESWAAPYPVSGRG